MYLKVGKITKQVGLKGEVKIYSTTSFAKKRFKKGNKVLVKIENEYKELTVRTFRILNSDFFVVSFEELPSLETTNFLLNKEIFVEKNRDILDENQYFYRDLIDCTILDEKNNILGKVIKIEEFPAQITLKCQDDKHDFFVPFISQFVKNVDVDKKEITIKVIEGLLWNLKS